MHGRISAACGSGISIAQDVHRSVHTIARTKNILFHCGIDVIVHREIRSKRPTRGALLYKARGAMAADGIGPKSSGLVDLPLDTLAEESATVVEVSGVIKWFDVSKGYGFIVPDSGESDVLLHVTCLRRDGYQTAYEGARIVCEALARPKGLQAFRVLSMDESTAVHPAQVPARTHVSVTPTSGLERAVVKWFNRLRGFGFLTRGEGTPDIFVHMETLRRFGMTELRPGQTVLVRHGPGPKGLMAAEVRPDGGPSGPSSH
jgi:CspA family cold shock protein